MVLLQEVIGNIRLIRVRTVPASRLSVKPVRNKWIQYSLGVSIQRVRVFSTARCVMDYFGSTIT